MKDPVIEITNLRVRRAGKTICQVPTLVVPPGSRLAVLGPNGSGKSTLLRLIAGLEREYEGRCEVAVGWRQRTYVHQSPYLFRGTVLANVTFGLRAGGHRRRPAARAARRWLDRLGVAHLAGRHVAQLSGGELRRVALARALAIQPQLLLLDEPLADLDGDGVEAVCRVLAELPDVTMLIASPTPLPDNLCTAHCQLAPTPAG